MFTYDLSSAKRGRTERSGVHSWHPYYAGFAEQFVEDALKNFAFPEAVVMDPWNGSGTTTFVAQRLGYRSIGVELNPVMVMHSRAKNLQIATREHSIAETTKAIIEQAMSTRFNVAIPDNGLGEWVRDERAIELLVAIRDAINDLELHPNVFTSTENVWRKLPTSPSVLEAFHISGLFQLLRRVGNFKQGANPTWLTKIDTRDGDLPDVDEIIALYKGIIRDMLGHLLSAYSRGRLVPSSWVQEGDARNLPLKDETVDSIITSPPYLTRIDYTVATQPELLLLGYSNEGVDRLRRMSTGAPVVVDKAIQPRPVWGQICATNLTLISSHTSKASKSYYLPLYLQYFCDIEGSIREIHRVLKSGGKAVLVVQSSYYKEIEIDLGEIFVEMSSNMGFCTRRVRREIVRQHMAHVNTKSSRYKANKVYFEDVILMEKQS